MSSMTPPPLSSPPSATQDNIKQFSLSHSVACGMPNEVVTVTRGILFTRVSSCESLKTRSFMSWLSIRHQYLCQRYLSSRFNRNPAWETVGTSGTDTTEEKRKHTSTNRKLYVKESKTHMVLHIYVTLLSLRNKRANAVKRIQSHTRSFFSLVLHTCTYTK